MKAPRLRTPGFAVVRSPLLSAQTFEAEAAPAEAPRRLAALMTLAASSPIREALTTSSPSLVARLASGKSADDVEKVSWAVMRYVARMRGRATPFGLCAGYTIVPIASEQRPDVSVSLSSVADYRAVLRLDVDSVMDTLRRHAVLERDRRAAFLWSVSAEVTRQGDTLKVYRRTSAGDVSFIDVERTRALECVLELGAAGRSFSELCGVLTDFSAEPAAREAYVHRLIDEGVLVPAAYPSVATDQELDALLLIPELRDLAVRLRERRHGPIDDELTTLVADADAALDEAPATPAAAGALPGKRTAAIVDLLKPLSSGSLPQSLLRDIGALYSVLSRLQYTGEDGRHRRLREYLLRTYETRQVPLSLALDPDYGFDFPVDPEPIPSAAPEQDRWRLSLYTRAIRDGMREVALTEADLPEVSRSPAVPAGFALQAFLFRTPNGVRTAEPQFVNAPGTLFFGRATGLSADLRDRTRAFLAEQARLRPDCDLAQLTYFVPGRSAAFVQYPTLTPFEVTLAARPGLEGASSISVDDVLVSVRGQRAVLHSRKTGREILLLPTGAANPNRSDVPGIVRFLLTLRAGDAVPSFGWGLLAEAPFLPRLTFDGHILSLAQWNVDESETDALRKPKTVSARFEAVQALRLRLGLPRKVVFHERADLLLPVDLDDVLSVESWLDIARGRIHLREEPPVERSIVRGPEGPYHHECVIPLLAEPSSTSRADTPIAREAYDEVATFDRMPPGGRCLYLAIYGSRPELINIVRYTLRDLIIDARDERKIAKWFFLPFANPDPHIRLRFFGDPRFLYGEFLPRVHAALEPLIDARVVRTVSVLTYERESVRYGGREMLERCEDVFCASSEAAVMFHDEFDGDPANEQDLIVPVLHSLHAVLASADLEPKEAFEQARATAALYTRSDDPALPARRASSFLRAQGRDLGAPRTPEDLWGPDVAERFRASLADVRRTCAASAFQGIFADILHVHSIRLLTTWCAVPHAEAIAYHALQKWCSSLRART